MSWHYLQEGAEVFSVEAYLAGLRSARLRLSPTHERFCSRDSETECCRSFPSGMTSQPLTAHPGEVLLTSSAEAFLARTSAWQEKGQASPAPAPGYGARCTVSFAKYDRGTYSWKIHPCLFPEDSPLFLGTWPQQGMMRHGVCWELTMWGRRMSVRDSGCSHMIPTPTVCNAPNSGANTTGPTCQDAKNNGSQSQMARNTPPLNAVAGGALNPEWVEWLMGWPIGWTDLRPLGMDRCRWWQQSLLKDLNNFC